MSSTTMPPHWAPARAALQQVADGLTALGEANLWALTDAELLSVRGEVERLSSRLTAARLRSTREIDARGAAVAVGATSTVDWLMTAQRLHPGDAKREVELAAAVSDCLPATASALATGTITPAAAKVIADTDRALAKTASAAQRAEAEALLVEQASILDVRGLEAAGLHLRHLLDPDRGDKLADEEQEMVARRELRMRPNPDGSCRLDGYLDKEAHAFLRAGLDPLTQPRPAPDGQRDRRSAAQRNGDALVELVELAPAAGTLPRQAGAPVQVVVAIDLEDLRRRTADGGAGAGPHGYGEGVGARPGVFDTGLPLSAAAVRRYACDAQLVPVVLGAAGEPLDLGRAARTVPAGLRRALDLRDGGCAFPGCTRPPRWCQAHHIVHWVDGGETAAGNCVLLCGSHHRAVHHHGWDVCIGADGLPEFRPPGWIDPERAPRRNLTATLHARRVWWRPRRT